MSKSNPAFNGAPEGPAPAQGPNHSVLDTPKAPTFEPQKVTNLTNPIGPNDHTDHSDSGMWAKRHAAWQREFPGQPGNSPEKAE